MNDKLTEIAFVLDRSGSMSDMQEEAIGGFNSFLSGQKKEPGEARLTLVLFDHEYLVHCTHQNIHFVEPLTKAIYVPRGCTALHDAIGTTIDKLGVALDQTPEPEKPSRVLFVILTDGFENASTHYLLTQIHQMINHQRDKYSWQFIFLGAGLGTAQTFQTSSSLGIPYTHSVAAQGGQQGMMRSMNAINMSCSAYRGQNNANDIQYTQNLASAGVWGGAPGAVVSAGTTVLPNLIVNPEDDSGGIQGSGQAATDWGHQGS
jgi:hypothetical protein